MGPAPMASDATGQGIQDYGPVSGRVTAVVVDPADNTGNTVYVGGAFGGLWRSQNGASGMYGDTNSVTWTTLTDDQATLAIGAIALQPGNTSANLSNLILVGTGEANVSGDAYYGLGFLRSTNQGATWTLISSANNGTRSLRGLSVSKIAFSSRQSNVVVAGVGSPELGEIAGAGAAAGGTKGIYYSTDAGATWSLASMRDGATPTAAESVGGLLYNAANQLFYAALRRHGFYSSSDGVTWTRLPNQPGGGVLIAANCPAHPVSGSPVCPIARGELTVVPGRNEMYVWITDFDPNLGDIDRGIWKTSDGGTTWTQISTAGIDTCGDIVGGCGTEQGEYNLTLAAVPNGAGATDLYAGSVNLFKCSISNLNPTCNNTPFINLTHAYGCPPLFATSSHVHPNQHAIDFMVVNASGHAVMYFGNDGGVYRALDGYLGLTTGSCGGTNQFDSLNGTIGSLAQFVALSQQETNAAVLLGGTQGNGSPATNSAATNLTWTNVNNGDGAFNAIDRNNANSWFTSHPDVGGGQLAVEHCALGPSCHAQDFAAGLVVTSNDLQGDDGAFNFPFLLDPQAASEMLVGTCRVWRGPSQGGTFLPLSVNFETGTQGATCTGAEANSVRSIAAGGPKDGTGLSKVVYATTSGFGSLTGPLGMPAGGRIFVTMDASSTLMTEVTGAINPAHYPISSVAIDGSDQTGRTAFVTMMGFGGGHVFKTANAGATWTDFSGTGIGAIPDAPANIVLVDAPAGLVYVGTDVGVFVSPTAAANWTEVGPTSGPGILPNVAVLDLKLFNYGGQKLLRAATHGRGLWQITLTPGFQISISDTPQTTFPAQQVSFHGLATALGGYSSSVGLSCSSGSTPPPATCTASPSNLIPNSNAAAFTVAASGTVGDYIFNIHGDGSDSNHVQVNQSVTLHVVDFSVTAPNPSALAANRPSSSNSTNFSVTASGSFNQVVQLTCSGLPAGASCRFSPSNSVAPTAGSPASLALTVDTSANTPPGTYSVTIAADTTSPSATRTQALSLTVTATPDYLLTISNSSQSVPVNQTATLNGTLTAINGYSAPVNLSCGSGAPPTCTFSSSTITPSPAGTTFTVALQSPSAHTYSFNLNATGTDPQHLSHSAAVTFRALVDFSILATPVAPDVKPGQTALFTLRVTPTGGNFEFPVSFACAGVPAQATCTFSPTTIPVGSGTTDVLVSITTAGPNLAGMFANRRNSAWAFLLAWPILSMCVILARAPARRSLPMIALLATVFSIPVLVLQGCGGGASGGGSPPPPVPVSVTISPASASVEITHAQQFQASIVGTTDTQVRWDVNNLPGGNPQVGTVSATGLYTAPSVVPNPVLVVVTAVSQADQLKKAPAEVTIVSLVSIDLAPIVATVPVSGTIQFTASISGASNKQASWSVNNIPGGNPGLGSIDANGLYRAPATAPNPRTVRITATSQVDWTKSASADITITDQVVVTINPSSAGLFTSTQQQFMATVTGSANTAVNWTVNGVAGGNNVSGKIDTAGLYTAPALVPNPPTVNITATSQASPASSASAAVTIKPQTPTGAYPIKITVTSGSISKTSTITLNVIP